MRYEKFEGFGLIDERDLFAVTSMVVADVGDVMCWLPMLVTNFESW